MFPVSLLQVFGKSEPKHIGTQMEVRLMVMNPMGSQFVKITKQKQIQEEEFQGRKACSETTNLMLQAFSMESQDSICHLFLIFYGVLLFQKTVSYIISHHHFVLFLTKNRTEQTTKSLFL